MTYSDSVEKRKLEKYRQQRILKNGELSWRCLGRNCGASIKTDADITRVTVYNDKHSGDHPATMRTLMSPLPISRPAVPAAAPLVTPEPGSAPPSSGSLPASDPSPICCTPIAPSKQNSTSFEQQETEVYRLMARLSEWKLNINKLLDHTIESDTSDSVEKRKLEKYRQQRILKNGELSWRCLGRNCGASIKTDADITRVTVYNDKHSGDHPDTMRTLLSPLPISRPAVPAAAPLVTPEPGSAPPSSGSLPASDPSPNCSTPIAPSKQNSTSFEQPKTEVYRLKAEVERMEIEYKKLLDHTIESDTRLPQYTDQILLGNYSSRVNQTACARTTVDFGVQYEMHGGSAPTAMDISRHYDLLSQIACTRCAESANIIDCLKPTIEVFESDNQCLKLQLNTCAKVTRHIPGLMRPLIDPVTQVICMPGGGLLDGVGSKIPTRPEKQCEVLIVLTKDMARGKQHVIYSTTLPDLQTPSWFLPPCLIVTKTPSMTRYNTNHVYFDSIGRRHFTRHGQHLSMKGKRLLAKIILESLAYMGNATSSASKPKTAPSQPRQRVPAPVTSSVTTPAPTVVPGLPPTAQHQQSLTYAEAVTGSLLTDALLIKKYCHKPHVPKRLRQNFRSIKCVL
ncbi:hypothetical protein J6590_103908 [Homalodisca vitripennis]|nr:hypothetical protein J6590_103908 [Homalodisca vitripennis]